MREGVTFLGGTSKYCLRLHASADAFLFASLTETLGLVVLEAMSSGLPRQRGAGRRRHRPPAGRRDRRALDWSIELVALDQSYREIALPEQHPKPLAMHA